jgi:hypothetical protein
MDGAKLAAISIAAASTLLTGAMTFDSLHDWCGVAWFMPTLAGGIAALIGIAWAVVISPG